jgi:hypothetical protein
MEILALSPWGKACRDWTKGRSRSRLTWGPVGDLILGKKLPNF